MSRDERRRILRLALVGRPRPQTGRFFGAMTDSIGGLAGSELGQFRRMRVEGGSRPQWMTDVTQVRAPHLLHLLVEGVGVEVLRLRLRQDDAWYVTLLLPFIAGHRPDCQTVHHAITHYFGLLLSLLFGFVSHSQYLSNSTKYWDLGRISSK